MKAKLLVVGLMAFGLSLTASAGALDNSLAKRNADQWIKQNGHSGIVENCVVKTAQVADCRIKTYLPGGKLMLRQLVCRSMLGCIEDKTRRRVLSY